LSSSSPLTVLTSAVGLGIYLPALLIQRRLAREGVAAEVEVIEAYYLPEKQQAHLANRDAQQRNFALAKIANRMVRDVAGCLDTARIGALFANWAEQGRERFVVWSGFWLPVLDAYRRYSGSTLRIDHCHIDAAVSASFRIHPDLADRGRDIWLWNWERRELGYRIAIGDATALPYAQRKPALVLHGGGWGLGTYLDTITELSRSDHALNIVVSQAHTPPTKREGDRHFALESDWRPWVRNREGGHDYPPMHEIGADGTGIRLDDGGHPAMHEIIRGAKAIVSKPGGCTLIDSLAAATPLVLLEAYSASEERNAWLWRHLGFAIDYEQWRESGFDEQVLQRLHRNLMAARDTGVDYIRDLLEQSQEPAREAAQHA